MTDLDLPPAPQRSAVKRTIAAFAVAFAFALGVYWLIDAARPDTGLISFTFLLILPTVVSAFIAYVADPWGERSKGFYRMIPVWLILAVVATSVVVLREGTICILMLSPLWFGASMLGVTLMYRWRGGKTKDYSSVFSSSLLVIPLIAMQAEPYIPLPQATATVTRSIVVDAPPAKIWPLLRGIPDVRPGEGQWNLSQDIFGVPRPVGAQLFGEGIGADRRANWSNDVRFREQVIDWQPGERIGWRFIFDQIDGWKFTDRHLMPDSAYFKVTTGGYRMEPMGDGRTRLIIHTDYWMQTPVNAYSRLWGELFLGDVENNLLALVKGRAERGEKS
jgi:hypothetical protein